MNLYEQAINEGSQITSMFNLALLLEKGEMELHQTWREQYTCTNERSTNAHALIQCASFHEYFPGQEIGLHKTFSDRYDCTKEPLTKAQMLVQCTIWPCSFPKMGREFFVTMRVLYDYSNAP